LQAQHGLKINLYLAITIKQRVHHSLSNGLNQNPESWYKLWWRDDKCRFLVLFGQANLDPLVSDSLGLA
jgi:hypothetical protein